MDTFYSLQGKFVTRNPQALAYMLQIQEHPFHKRNPTKAQKINRTPHNNSGRPKQPTLINRQIMETETEQRHIESNRSY